MSRKKKIQRTGIVESVMLSFRREHFLATVIGFLLGGFVPLATYWVAHYEVNFTLSWTDVNLYYPVLLVLGGLVYSANTVYEYAKMAFRENWVKAVGFVILIEGVMVTAEARWLSIASLVYLIAINGVATGVNVSVSKEANV
jgi:hypothetical protein